MTNTVAAAAAVANQFNTIADTVAAAAANHFNTITDTRSCSRNYSFQLQFTSSQLHSAIIAQDSHCVAQIFLLSHV